MSSKKDNFENLAAYAGGPDTDISGGLVPQGIGIFCFGIGADSGEIHTIKLPGSFYIPGFKQMHLRPRHRVQFDGGDGTYIKNVSHGCL